MPHLFSGLIAFGLAAAILFSGRMIAIQLERSTLSSTAPAILVLKDQGLAFQRVAAQARDVLPVYGTSELKASTERGPFFFRHAPTGFQVSPVGRGGMRSLILLQKVGALGSDLRGKKLAISISAVWFFAPNTAYAYEGTFSLIAASELTFGTALDFKLKQAIASRMLQFPRTLAKSPLLEFALRRLASGRWLDRVVFYALWPLGEMQNVILDLQDHFAALSYILRGDEPAPPHRPDVLNWPSLITRAYILLKNEPAPPRRPNVLDWPSLIAKATEEADVDQNKKGKASDMGEQMVARRGDAWFLQGLDQASEWVDLELLLRALKETHAQALLLSTPLDGQFYDQLGVSRSARECYYKKMRALAQRYHFALVEFGQHDEDRTFLNHRERPPVTHLTAKGWMFYNRALDDFFHDRTPEG
jgi:D-alanine transfer protein